MEGERKNGRNQKVIFLKTLKYFPDIINKTNNIFPCVRIVTVLAIFFVFVVTKNTKKKYSSQGHRITINLNPHAKT